MRINQDPHPRVITDTRHEWVKLSLLGRVHIRFTTQTPRYSHREGWLVTLDLGLHNRDQFRHGAGYIGGRTAYLGWKVKRGHQRLPKLVAGWTRNANRVPYLPS